MIEMVQIDYHLTPFRAQRFAALYRPIVPRVARLRGEELLLLPLRGGLDHFVHASLWEDRAGFQRFWMSREMHDMREKVMGLYVQPLLPTWATIVDRG